MRLFTTLLLLLFTLPVFAQTPGDCTLGTAERDLDVSDVQARLFTTGSLFYGNTTTDGRGYLVPKEAGNLSPIFAANLWVAGMVGGELRAAGARYNRFEFYPGPLTEAGELPNPADCSEYDRIWAVSTLDVEQYEDTGIATADLAEWPVELGAEVIDGDGIAGNYDLAAGDRPRVFGSQTAFWVMNDVGNAHLYSGSEPIGLEVQVSAFAVSSTEPALDQATFYRYRLVNRNAQPFEAAYLGLWSDFDLGDSQDDYIGSDSTRGLAYVYNAFEEDDVYGVPPAAGMELLSGARSTRWVSKNFNVEILGAPDSPSGFHRALQGLWNDGTPITEGGIGYETGGPVVTWAWPGDPVAGTCWNMADDCDGESLGNQDFRHLVSSPPFTLAPGEAKTFDMAFLFAQGLDRLDSITELRAASDLVQAAYDDGSLFDTRFPVASEDDASAPSGLALAAVYPNPVRAQATISYSVDRAGPVRLSVYDVLGREVAVLAGGIAAAGDRRVEFETSDLASGVYLVVLEAGNERHTRKLLLVR